MGSGRAARIFVGFCLWLAAALLLAGPAAAHREAAAGAPVGDGIAIPVREALPWVIFAGVILMLAIYFVGAEEGATSIVKGMYVHEFVHDGRHLLGFPCH